jgi:ABC-type uncharacterized transport system ATPase subunit
MTKRFGGVAALDSVSVKVAPGTVHALLGENGAGKSTLVKCIMGYYKPDSGSVLVDGREERIANPRQAQMRGLGMVYQHFTLVPHMTVLENLVMARASVPAVIHWGRERAALTEFLQGMPFRVPLDAPVQTLAAGEKQKAEILKQLYLKSRFLILDEPTSVLTPQEADEVLGLIRDMAHAGAISVLIITHKFREVMAFADTVSVLRRGKLVGDGRVADFTPDDLARMMIGDTQVKARVERTAVNGNSSLDIFKLSAEDDEGGMALADVTLSVKGGEIVGVAGVSGNGQSDLVEVLAGLRRVASGTIHVNGALYRATRAEMKAGGVSLLPEEPLRNACVARMSVAENMAFRAFDEEPMAAGGWWLRPGAIRRVAEDLIQRYRVKTSSPDAPISSLSGGNVQRAVLARELSGPVEVLIAANPVFGLDFAAVADIHGQIVAARNRGAAVLLISEDLDELLELSDRIVVLFEGRVVHTATTGAVDRTAIGRHMAGHEEAA